MLGKELVELLEVAGLLVIHVLHERPEVRMSFDDRGRLGRVDPHGCEFAGMVDTKLQSVRSTNVKD